VNLPGDPSGAEINEVPNAPGQSRLARTPVILAIGLVALFLRVIYIIEIWPNPVARLPMIDAEAYRTRALEILGGDWLGASVYYLDPLYPFFLAALYAIIPPDSMGILIAQAFLDSLSVMLIMLIARRVFDDRTALIAGVIAASYKLFFYYDGLLLKAPLMIFLMVSALYLVTRAADQARVRAWFPAGLLVGLAALTRGNSLLFAPGLLIWLVGFGQGTRRVRLVSALVFGLGLAAVILPVTLRNYVVGDDVVLLNSQAGQNFYIGNFHANDTGAYLAPPFLRPNPKVEEADFKNEAQRISGREMKPSEVSNFWLRRGVEEIASDPSRFIKHTFRKAIVFLNHYEIPDNSSYEYYQLHVSKMLNLPFPSFAWILPLGLCGMFLSRKRPLPVVLIIFFFSYASGLLLFFNLSRMRLPVVPVVILFAAFFLGHLWTLVRNRELKQLVAPGLALAVLYPITLMDIIHEEMSVRYYNQATGFLTLSKQRWSEGNAFANKGDNVSSGRSYAESFRQRSLADKELLRGLEEFPNYGRLQTALRASMVKRVIQLENLGLNEQALEHALRLTRVFDRFSEGHLRLGSAYERLGRRKFAGKQYLRALELEPSNKAAAAALERIRMPPRVGHPTSQDLSDE
jgi:4-amino-4-deoxy-L-arabinose transferase-like glycosyltransferase